MLGIRRNLLDEFKNVFASNAISNILRSDKYFGMSTPMVSGRQSLIKPKIKEGSVINKDFPRVYARCSQRKPP